MAQPYLGQIMAFPFNFAPVGWFQCNGQLLPISQYTALFSLLGTYYGGNGTSTFALPNINVGSNGATSYAVAGQGQCPGLSSYVLGEVIGEDNHTLLTTEMPAHNHSLQVYPGTTTASNVPAAVNTIVDPLINTFDASNATPQTTLAPSAMASVGSGVPHNNDQPALALNYCIAYQGIFPSRA